MGKQISKQKTKSAKAAKYEPKKRGNVFDTFVKQMFGRIFVFIDFLFHYADKEFVDAIDLSNIRPAPTHYIGKDGAERIVDLVFECPLKHGGGSLMAVIVFEHQGGSLKRIPYKLLKYVSAIWDAEIKKGKKVLSAPYFIVLRTAKRPHRGGYPAMTELVAKGRGGKPLGHVPDVKYKVVDLPAWDFKKIVGSPVLRLALGILQTMTVDDQDNLPAAFLPLGEIPDDGQKVEFTQEFLDFVANAMASHNRRLDEATVSKILKPVFHGKEQAMIKTIFEEKYDAGKVEGRAEGKAEGRTEGKAEGRTEGRTEGKTEMVLTFLRAKFKRVPKRIEKSIRQMTDPNALDSLAAHIANCESVDEFAEEFK